VISIREEWRLRFTSWDEAHYHADGFGSVTARELVGPPDVAVVSVQFVVHREPPYAHHPLPRPVKARELELA
jgi:hypothetical protein